MLHDVLLAAGGVEVSALSVYADIFKFGEGYLQTSGEDPGHYKANPIAYWRNNGEEQGHFRVMFEDEFAELLGEIQRADFAIMNCNTYFGRRNRMEHASKMFAMVFDLDGVTEKTLRAFLSGATEAGVYPYPTYIVLSGHGVHLYYVFDEPVSLYPNIKLQMKELKYALIKKIWNQYTSTDEHPQMQGIGQSFRVIGGKTKEGAGEDMLRAFRMTTHPTSVEELNRYVDVPSQVNMEQLWKASKVSLDEAKERWPEWYQKVVVEKNSDPSYWDLSEKVHGDNPYAIYTWWLEQIRSGATYGHRYFAIMCLAIYAIKCRYPYEDLERDALALVPFLNSLNPDEPFTEADCEAALECYDMRYCTFPIKDIIALSNIYFERNIRNHNSRWVHLQADIWRDPVTGRPKINKCRQQRELTLQFMRENHEIKGRPSKKEVVTAWRKEHPSGTKAACIRETGLSKKTVYKWWHEE